MIDDGHSLTDIRYFICDSHSFGLGVDSDSLYELKVKYTELFKSNPEQNKKLVRKFVRDLIELSYSYIIGREHEHDESTGTGLFSGKGYKSAASYQECEMWCPIFSNAWRLCERALEYYPDVPKYYLFGLDVMIREAHGKYHSQFHRVIHRYPHDKSRLGNAKMMHDQGKDLKMSRKERSYWEDLGKEIERRLKEAPEDWDKVRIHG